MTANKTSIPRLHSVRFKDGGATIRVIRPDARRENQGKMERAIRATIETHTDHSCAIGGFAFCVWDADGGSSVVMENFDGPIPAIVIPDFVRNRLLSYKIIQWALEDMRDDDG